MDENKQEAENKNAIEELIKDKYDQFDAFDATRQMQVIDEFLNDCDYTYEFDLGEGWEKKYLKNLWQHFINTDNKKMPLKSYRCLKNIEYGQ